MASCWPHLQTGIVGWTGCLYLEAGDSGVRSLGSCTHTSFGMAGPGP
jgi:hypothetical protein